MTAAGRPRWEGTVERSPLLAGAGAVALLLLAGCASTEVASGGSRSAGESRRPTPETVTIEVLERPAITRPFRVIGVVQATTANWQAGRSDAAMLAALKKEARTLGGDAITELVKNPAKKPDWWWGPFFAGEVHTVRWAAQVIVWLD